MAKPAYKWDYRPDGVKVRMYCGCVAFWTPQRNMLKTHPDYKKCPGIERCPKCDFFPWYYPNRPQNEERR